jgi:hypothetical protein
MTVLDHPRAPAPDWLATPAEAVWAYLQKWMQNDRFGLRQCHALPPMDHNAATLAGRELDDLWWNYPDADHARVRRAFRAVRCAIEAAQIEHGGVKAGRGAKLREALAERDGTDCWVCGRELGDDQTIEHVEARANGGQWAIDNLRLAHGHCNRTLGALPVAVKETVRARLKELDQ